ncbi:MAG: NAD-dependent epimerase/dehydratase family protein, partial [Actinomycetota bacterium]|nr:NAD-dependent epimerase/dehydratase family protein [Actinomycetota bacterium]
MPRSLLILGGTGFVGPALAAEGLARGWGVTTFTRGQRPASGENVERLHGDRTQPGALAALAARDWDLVLDTWSGAPRAVRDSAQALTGRAGGYVYISSGSVYAPPVALGVSEDARTVTASPDAEAGEYSECKRGAELAVLAAFGERALILRPGLILGPGEDVGRLPWWLARMARGGEVLAPGPPDLGLQMIDCRDLAAFALTAGAAGVAGPLNTVSHAGHATTRSLLEACREVAAPPGTELRWLAPAAVHAAGIEPWIELPIWIPPGHAASARHAADVTRVHAAGLHCRPVSETVRDTWAWLG